MIRHTTNDFIQAPWRFKAGLALLGSVIVPLATMVASGCESPYQRDAADDLRRSVQAAVDREVAGLPDTDAPRTTFDTAIPLPPEFDDRIDELDALGPKWVDAAGDLDLGKGLDGDDLTPVSLSLEGAVRSGILNNLGIQRTRIAQGISAAEVVRAEAMFDAVLGAGFDFARLDEPNPDIVLPSGAGPAGDFILPQDRNISQWGFNTDIRKPLTSGGALDVGFSGTRQENFATGNSIDPNPAFESSVTLGLSQPLLRGFGEDVNTAGIQLARNADRRAAVDLRERLLSLVVEVERAYWNVVYTRQELEVARWLVAEGERIRDILENRRGFDTTLAQYADAVATVESRKTRLIKARRDIGRANDTIKALLNDPDLPVGGEFDIIPVDFMIDAPYTFDVRDSITTALAESPVIDSAVLDIDDASINEIVARNGRLPALDLRAEMAWLGLASEYGQSVRGIDGDFVDYVVGLQFSQPIGNRAAESVLRQARLRRSGAVIGYRQAVQKVVLDVKYAIRDIEAGFSLVGQARNFRLAQAENLRALEALRETLAALTPEFLNLLFQRQERLAEAQLQETGALVAYNLAIAELQKSVGSGLEASGIDLIVVDVDSDDEDRVE